MNSNFARNAGLKFENNDSPIRSLAVLILSLAFGFVFFAFDPTARTALVGLAGFAAVGALLAYPELALALYVVVGDVKGDERVAVLLPWDLTLALGGLLIAGMLLNLLPRANASWPLPGSLFPYPDAGRDDGRQLRPMRPY